MVQEYMSKILHTNDKDYLLEQFEILKNKESDVRHQLIEYNDDQEFKDTHLNELSDIEHLLNIINKRLRVVS